MATIPSFPSFRSFPSIDFSKLDISQLDLSKLDLSKIDLSKITLPSFQQFEVAGVDTDKIVAVLRDAVYVAIGFGVLTFQQLQVRRRELAASLGSNPVVSQLGLSKEQLEEVVRGVEARMSGLADLSAVEARIDTALTQFEARIDAAVARLEGRLPEQAGAVLGQAHDLAKVARKQVRGLIRNAA